MSTYDMPDSVLELYENKKEVTLKEKIKKLLKKYGELKANLTSDALVEQLSSDIIEIVNEKEK
tara:strand:- start:303 stop:491 length:189 start_codon:yes stop_codon:yes gene_type:complete